MMIWKNLMLIAPLLILQGCFKHHPAALDLDVVEGTVPVFARYVVSDVNKPERAFSGRMSVCLKSEKGEQEFCRRVMHSAGCLVCKDKEFNSIYLAAIPSGRVYLSKIRLSDGPSSWEYSIEGIHYDIPEHTNGELIHIGDVMFDLIRKDGSSMETIKLKSYGHDPKSVYEFYRIKGMSENQPFKKVRMFVDKGNVKVSGHKRTTVTHSVPIYVYR